MKAKPYKFYIGILLFFCLLSMTTACSLATTDPTRQVSINQVQITVIPTTKPPFPFPTSEADTITVHGDLIVLNPTSMIPAPNDSIYLVPLPADQPISTIPQFEVGTVPQAVVDESEGEFVFTNIAPGQYAVVVITMGTAQIPVRYQDSGSYVVFTLDDSQLNTTFELGSLTLP